MNKVKVKFWYYMQNNGDGSASPLFFNSEKAAEAYAENDNERYCDDISFEELEFDIGGNLLTPNPVHYSLEEDEE